MSDYRSDSMIADEVAQVLASVSTGRRILVAVHDGRVTLRGVVADATLRRSIKDQVADIEGVAAITDLLRVDAAALSGQREGNVASPVTPIGEARRTRPGP